MCCFVARHMSLELMTFFLLYSLISSGAIGVISVLFCGSSYEFGNNDIFLLYSLIYMVELYLFY